MRGLIVASLVGLLAACSQQSPVAPVSGDTDLRQLLVGPWHPAADSDDYGAATEEVFAADGTYTSTTYRNSRCTTVQSTGKFKWSIDNGILLTWSADADTSNKPDRDQVLILDGKHLKTRSVESAQVYSRDRGYLCATRAEPVGAEEPHQTDDKGAKPPPGPNKRPKPKFGP
jgi:hypothetical protein